MIKSAVLQIRKLAYFGRSKIQQRGTEADETASSSPSGRANSPVHTGKGSPKGGSGTDPQKIKANDSRPDRPVTRSERKTPPWTIDQFPVPVLADKSRFHDFGLPDEIMHGIAELNFQYCTPIQSKALPEVLAGRDLIGKANTGTGKSAVFLIAIFARILEERKAGHTGRPAALIIAPTRELVLQIAKDGQKLAKHCQLKVAAVYGGADYQGQEKELRDQTVDVVVATPGRLLDFISKRTLSLDNCNILVLDEADRMLDMGFIPDVRRIIGRVPPKEKRQTLLFSATVSDDVQRLAQQWCVNPTFVEAEAEQIGVDSIDQRVYLVTTEEKFTVVCNLLRQQKDDRILIFANMKNEVKRLSDRLLRYGIDCAVLSGDVAQDKRESRLERFRAGKVKVLVATDVAGRGIHIEGIQFVINYTLPYEPEDYVHRIGRTGRAGAAGVAVSFACEEGSFFLPDIEAYIGRKLECTLPDEALLVPPVKTDARPLAEQDQARPANTAPRKRRSSSRRGPRPGGGRNG